ncbi:MAG: sugar transferase, partial [Parcubacteria group bacterium]|nr:sugar transferase [Parcubacteria group bacterium]
MRYIQDEPVNIPFAKRLLDIVVSAFLLVLVSPLIALIALAIKLEGIFSRERRGPVLYAETRISQGRPFTLRKFRIFKTAVYEPAKNNGDVVHTKPLERNPQNITACGTLLKTFYLDELPQLWNVLRGDMSLVGPRPWNPVDYQNEILRGEFRKKVIRAGLTGPVQIHKLDAGKHGGEHKLDADYIMFVKNKNGLAVAARDIKLLLQSLWFMLRG